MGVKDMTEKPAEGAAKLGPSPEVIERIKKAIAEAETIEEVTRLEKALKSGILPEDLKVEGAKEEAPAAPAPAAAEAPKEKEKPKEEAGEKKDVGAKKEEDTSAMKVDG